MDMDDHRDFAVPALTGTQPELAGARVTLVGDVLEWHVDGAAIDVGAGSGVAAAIVDAMMGSPNSPAPGRERSIPVDQTHTSVIVDERWVVKIVGFWGAADRSAAILERITRQHAAVTPRFAGAVQWEHPDRGATTLALVTEYIPNSEDGWTWAVDDVLTYLTDSSRAAGVPVPDWPARVGELTAHMHAALVVEPDADTPGDGLASGAQGDSAAADPRTDDRAQAEGVFKRVFGVLGADAGGDKHPDPDEHPAFADEGFVQRMRARRASLEAAIRTIPETSPSPLVIPHGDYHVGQLLRTDTGRYLVLDFDGDPQWDAARRLRPDGAARDVAHMLASIDLVASVVQRRLGHADERAWEWARAAQHQFLDAYRAIAPEGLLDASPLPGFVAEQLLHELLYADQFLARWRYAPDGVISRRYPAGPGQRFDAGNPDELYFPHPLSALDATEHPWNPPASPTT